MYELSRSERQQLMRQHKEAQAALEYAHEQSNELRRQIATLPPDEQRLPHIQQILLAVDHSDRVYEETRKLLTTQPVAHPSA